MDINKDLVAASATPLILAIVAEGDYLRLRDPQARERAVRRAAAVDRRDALPGAAPARAAGPHRGQVGHLGDGPEAQVLPHHGAGPRATRRAAPAVAGGGRGAAQHLARGLARRACACRCRPMAEHAMHARSSDSLEAQIEQWRSYLRGRQAIRPVDVAELEDHLRDEVAALRGAGLSENEAFLVAVKRMGALDAISNEFAREHSERLWKQLVIAPADTTAAGGRRADRDDRRLRAGGVGGDGGEAAGAVRARVGRQRTCRSTCATAVSSSFPC